MQRFGLELDVKNSPLLDTSFLPFLKFQEALVRDASRPVAVAVERLGGETEVYHTCVHEQPEQYEADAFYIERLVKFLLWSKGGFRVYVCGDEKLAAHIKRQYSPEGSRSFDYFFMQRVYERPFEVVSLPYAQTPQTKRASVPMGGHTDGCRIGFDAGCSDRKVTAMRDGEVVYSEETVWLPQKESDPQYHYDGILDSLRRAASCLPRVDAIGVSSAGIYMDNRAMVASLFRAVPDAQFETHCKDIFIRAAAAFGGVPLVVANDGDVTALEGTIRLQDTQVLGISMGSSEAGGYVDAQGNIVGWLNELAFAPVDLQENAACDDWSKDLGCGANYFSQEAAVRLARRAGILLPHSRSDAEKLAAIQELASAGDKRARKVFATIGCYLGHTIALYATFYELKHILLLGRVMSGEGGNIILTEALRVLYDEYPDYTGIRLHLPEEKVRRVGQSTAAATLPKIAKL